MSGGVSDVLYFACHKRPLAVQSQREDIWRRASSVCLGKLLPHPTEKEALTSTDNMSTETVSVETTPIAAVSKYKVSIMVIYV